MELYEAVEKRYSVRAYQDKPVEQEKLDRVLDAARLAPSGGNRQAWKFVVIRDEQTRKQLASACNDQAFVGEAPVVIGGVGLMPDRTMSCRVPGDPVDVAIAMEHIALAATAEGLGTCWIGAFNQDKVRQLMGVPDTAVVIEVMTLGYPADKLRAKNRKPLGEIVCYDKFQ